MAKRSKSKKVIPLDPVERLDKLGTQKFIELRNNCIKKGSLFEDDHFPANNRSFYCKDCKIEFKWLRPFQLKTNPKFCINSSFTHKLNLTQGKIGNFWFLGALAALTLNKELFEQVVPIEQTFDAQDYAGIFYFNLWYYGKWRKVVVDDRLPTINGELIMTHDKFLDEFWPSLLEKAYAKLVGCYEALVGSYASEALEDFTGGISETYSLKPSDIPGNMFNIIYKSLLRSSLIITTIESDHKDSVQLTNGLYVNNFYTITAVNSIELENDAKPVQLVRLRNSWCVSSDWKGAWGHSSKEWASISDEDKEQFGLILEFPGEFWMTFDNYKEFFTKIDICNVSNEKLNQFKFKWDVVDHDGSWEPGQTAGGGNTAKGPFHTNPKYYMFITSKDCDVDDSNYATIIIALMQLFRSSKEQNGLFDLKIGFQIYCLDKTDGENRNVTQLDTSKLKLSSNWFQDNKPVAGTKCYINIREVFGRFRLKPGNYMIIPSTFQPNKKGKFFLRFYHEKSDTNDDAGVNYITRSKYESRELLEKRGLFNVIVEDADSNCNLNAFDVYELFKKNIKSTKICFTLDQCRIFVALFDVDKDGAINYEQLKLLCIDLNECYTIFYTYNKEVPNYLTKDELKVCFDKMGIYAGIPVMNLVLSRYYTEVKPKNKSTEQPSNRGGTKSKSESKSQSISMKGIEFTNFAVCAVKMRNVILFWDNKAKNEDPSNKVRASKRVLSFNLKEFVEQMIYS